MLDRPIEKAPGLLLTALIGVLLDVGLARVVIDGKVQIDLAERMASLVALLSA